MLTRLLPPRYLVTHGHLIDFSSNQSPQFDVIIVDQFHVTSFFTTRGGVNYVPATSVCAVGEVKSTFYSGKSYFQEFSDKLKVVHQDLDRPLIRNTAADGLNGHTTIADAALGSRNRFLNNLYAFMFCVDVGDFDPAREEEFFSNTDVSILPNHSVLFQGGSISFVRAEGGAITPVMYPHEKTQVNMCGRMDWAYSRFAEAEPFQLDGMLLAQFLGLLTFHLSSCQLGLPHSLKYLSPMYLDKKTRIGWLSHDKGRNPEFC